MKIALINPCCSESSGRDLYSANLIGPLLTFQPNKRMALGIPLALPTLAAHTPHPHTVIIIDEEIEDINFDTPVDLVGITAMTFKAQRAYEIANEYRKRGVPVVLGGIHATVRPDEALEHVDCVVIGEAEQTWPRLVEDAAANRLQRKYEPTELPPLETSLPPRYDLVKNDRYLYTYLQTTRGCPFDCSFCSVTRVSGRKVRKKTVDQVLSEIEFIAQLPNKTPLHFIDRDGVKRRYLRNIAFIDDNFAIDRDHALSVCESLKQFQRDNKLVIPWYTQVNVSVGFDTELLTAMVKSNCSHLFIGFESLDPETLKTMNKKFNSPAKYSEAIQNIQNRGIRVIFSTIIGDENTSQASCEYLKTFLEKNGVFHVLLNILTPYPGTEMYNEMDLAGRILTHDHNRYNIRNVVFQPLNMSPKSLETYYLDLCAGIYNYDNLFARGERLLEASDHLRFPAVERIVILLGFIITCGRLILSKKLRPTIALKMLKSAPRLLLHYGSLYAFELMITSADFDDFATSEFNRIRNNDNTNRIYL